MVALDNVKVSDCVGVSALGWRVRITWLSVNENDGSFIAHAVLFVSGVDAFS